VIAGVDDFTTARYVPVLIPGTDDITVAMLMAGCGQVGPVEGEGRVGEDPLVGEAEATGRDP
jgi:hypothetical protein